MKAVIFQKLPIIEYVLDCGADIEAQDDHGYTPLHLAVKYKLPFAVRELVKRGASTTGRNNHGMLPIDDALSHTHTRIHRLLTGGSW